MAELKFMSDYSGQTVDELLALAATCRADGLVLAFEQAIQQKEASKGEDSLSEPECIVLAIEALEREVNNGGYAQFFVNESRIYTPIIVDALQRIGCPLSSQITALALNAAGFEGLSVHALKDALESYQAAYTRRHRRRPAPLIEMQIVSSMPPAPQPDPLGDALEEALNAFDQAYFRSGEDIAGRLFEFLRANKSSIQL